MNPLDVAKARTARLAREAAAPRVAYSTSTRTAEEDLYVRAEALACGEDFCHICSRCTNHFGEHDPQQILNWAHRPGLLQSLLEK